MTKMPDKISPVCYECGDKSTIVYTHEPISGDCVICGRKNLFNDRALNTNPIPQPVTDEARAKALDKLTEIENTKGSVYRLDIPDIWGFDGDTNKYIAKLGVWVGCNFDTIRAALLQTIPVQDAKAIISDAEVQGEAVALTGGANPPTGATQPEAIQKAQQPENYTHVDNLSDYM